MTMTTETRAAWHDVDFTFPMSVGIMARTASSGSLVEVKSEPTARGDVRVAYIEEGDATALLPSDWLCPALDYPVTFGAALDLWSEYVEACFYTLDGIGAKRAYGIISSAPVRQIRARHDAGETTDADRLTVAEGLRTRAEGMT